jgi:anaerobic magnesium-protoporphyrin IX monomethyl ester cyclase
MKIALVMPASTFLELPMVMQPLGLFYLAARLESLGHECEFYDLNVDEFPEDVYDQIWVSATSPQMKEIRKWGKVLAGYKAKSVLGGASVWANPDSCKELGYDLIVGGESDSPDNMDSILNTLSGPDEFRNTYLYQSVPISKTLDWVLPPVRRWSRKYSSQLTNREGVKIDCTTMFTSRGCPLECAFCESGRHGVIWDRLTRYEPLDVVEYQIKESKELGYNALAYYDDILPLNKKRTIELMKLHRKYDMIWRCFLRSDIINNQGGYDYLKELRDGGLVEIFVGVESASNEIKNNITKKTTIEQDTNIVQWCKDLGIRCKTSFILGLPGESMASMEETRRWILEHRPDRVQVGRLIPFKGTPLGNHPENYDLNYDVMPDDDWFYMGNNGAQHSFVSTSKVTRDEIDIFWHNLQKEMDELGIAK